jgi:putative endonuclease
MQWYTYIIYSSSTDRYYVGHTQNLSLRLERHNSGNSRSTKHGIPWEIVYFEVYSTKSEAMKREYEIKRKKSRKYIEELIGN